jgi:hypothetical protein
MYLLKATTPRTPILLQTQQPVSLPSKNSSSGTTAPQQEHCFMGSFMNAAAQLSQKPIGSPDLLERTARHDAQRFGNRSSASALMLSLKAFKSAFP